MSILWSIIVCLWFIRIIANVLAYVHLWWLKEYRFDRMWIHFHTEQGKRLLMIPWKIPHVSPKTIILIISSLILLIGIFILLPMNFLYRLIITDLLTFPVVSLFVLITKIPTAIYHQILIRMAVSKLRAHRSMIVIGITGSFGKTSTKEFLATILKTKYKVLKTEESKNSPIGIAETILKKLTPEHECFVVEMGAYKRGEIAFMTKMVQPQIGIITAVNAQHQDLFGSIETTMKAKYELIDGLTEKNIAIFNADNHFVLQMAEWARNTSKKIWFFTKNLTKIIPAEKTFIAKNIKSDIKQGVSFNLILGKEIKQIHAAIIGVHQASNILAAAAGAHAAGLSLSEIAKGISNIRPLTKTIQPVAGINNSLFINDTFNNNPDAARAALDVLVQAKGKKILVFQPMIELGKYAEISHADIGEHAAKICDEIILTNNNFYNSFYKGVQKINRKLLLQVLTTVKAAEYLRSVVHEGDIVLFKGKEAEGILVKVLK